MSNSELKMANPGAVGLAGFALTTFVLNVANAGLVPAALFAALPLGLFYGGLAQFIAGVLEFRTGNTFGMVAFTGYGSFWMALAALIYSPAWGWMPKDALGAALGVTLIAWTIFTVVMTYLSFMSKNRTVQIIFVLLSLLFILLVIAHYTESTAIKIFAGYEGIATAISAWYGMFEIIKAQFSTK
ncbi:GPR1/FUN34/yaaH family protein [Thermodesulfobium narugense DSM 14796]|uniref:GPR1/FUN34/yaaH family protein n=1 Tax=Thermodesulfobium narugense DSM 14796 TaxID=747365 RepID=M1E7F1_9BACT|nr:GPR1/FUN34/YaaH family transporter [Thermodesulfobium narugense]AEE15246.1 GPR1/FUN34/yaaH family protein [Thermodesulfobium narugense DSM 14796]